MTTIAAKAQLLLKRLFQVFSPSTRSVYILTLTQSSLGLSQSTNLGCCCPDGQLIKRTSVIVTVSFGRYCLLQLQTNDRVQKTLLLQIIQEQPVNILSTAIKNKLTADGINGKRQCGFFLPLPCLFSLHSCLFSSVYARGMSAMSFPYGLLRGSPV